jgi:hypothetical protein
VLLDADDERELLALFEDCVDREALVLALVLGRVDLLIDDEVLDDALIDVDTTLLFDADDDALEESDALTEPDVEADDDALLSELLLSDADALLLAEVDGCADDDTLLLTEMDGAAELGGATGTGRNVLVVVSVHAAPANTRPTNVESAANVIAAPALTMPWICESAANVAPANTYQNTCFAIAPPDNATTQSAAMLSAPPT